MSWIGGCISERTSDGQETSLSKNPLSSWACPDGPPVAGAACEVGLSCGYGLVCCEGQCADTVRCGCEGGVWACAAGPDCAGDPADALCPATPPAHGDACGASGLACGYGELACGTAGGEATVCGCWDGSFYCLSELDPCASAAPALAICPDAPPIGLSMSVPVVDGLHCEYGEECCCGVCHPSIVCVSAGDGFACLHTDACLAPGCPDACPAEAPLGSAPCVGEASCSYDETCCPDGSCMDTTFCSCAEGEWVCAMADILCPDACPADVPSGSCSGEASCGYDEYCCPDGTCTDTTSCGCFEGEWLCASALVICVETTCPEDPFDLPPSAYYADGLTCSYGMECCCGQCHPAIICDAYQGALACFYTDACYNPSCGPPP